MYVFYWLQQSAIKVVMILYFPTKHSPRTWLKCKLPFLTQLAIQCSWYKGLKYISSKFWMGRIFELPI